MDQTSIREAFLLTWLLVAYVLFRLRLSDRRMGAAGFGLYMQVLCMDSFKCHHNSKDVLKIEKRTTAWHHPVP